MRELEGMSMDQIVRFVPIEKIDREQRMVWGRASTPDLDSQGDRVSVDAIKSALPGYMKFANVREMHQPSAVGKTITADMDDKGLYIGAKVVDDAAWKKVKEQVYGGFSIGGKVTKREGDQILGLDLVEISLVDRPANPSATFDLWKADTTIQGAEQKTEQTVTEPPAVDAEPEAVVKTVSIPGGEVKRAEVSAVISAPKETDMELQKLAQSLGLPPDSTEEAVNAALGNAKSLNERNKELTEKLDKAYGQIAQSSDAVQQMQDMKAEAIIDGAIAKQYLDAIERAEALVFYRANPAACQKWIDNRSYKAVLSKEIGSASGLERVSPIEEVNIKAAELMKYDSKLTLATAQSDVLKGNPDLQERYNAVVVAGKGVSR